MRPFDRIGRSAVDADAGPFIKGPTGYGVRLLADLIAVTQTDLKRVLAYSTISQLGYMFLALGSGVQEHRLAALALILPFRMRWQQRIYWRARSETAPSLRITSQRCNAAVLFQRLPLTTEGKGGILTSVAEGKP